MSERDPRKRIERFRKEAKRWLKALRANDAEARQRLESALRRAVPEPGLRAVQHALALEQGSESWSALKEREEVAALTAGNGSELMNELLQSGCVFSGGPLDLPAKWRRAERIRVRHPELARASLHAAVLCGELEYVERLMHQDRRLVHEKAGPQCWEPLLMLCYGRLPLRCTPETMVDIARLLLDAGADPNCAFVTADEWRLRFCALAGVMGRGEMNVPEHPAANALARLLLERGADPNASQGLYNTSLDEDEVKWLDLLSHYGLDASAAITWEAEEDAGEFGSLFSYLLVAAAKNGQHKRLLWLLEHGVDPNARSTYTGLSAYQTALIAGEPQLAESLVRYGARAEALTGAFAFAAACMRGDASEAARVRALEPDVIMVGDLLTNAVERRNVEAVRLMLALGVDPNRSDRHDRLSLHLACEHRAISELLYDHGADPHARCYGATATAFALAGKNIELARFHAEHSRDVIDAVASGHVDLVREMLAQQPDLARKRDPTGNTPLHALPADGEQAEVLIALLLAHGADPSWCNDAGQTPAEKLDAGGLDEIADLLSALS